MMIKKLVMSWDLASAIVLTIAGTYLLNENFLLGSRAKDIYGVGVSVLSIIFSIYFAALSIIISSSDNEFVRFLEEKGQFTELIKTFKFTLVLLFVSLIVAISLYVYTVLSFRTVQTKWFFILFLFLTTYALFAVLSSALDSIKFAGFRAKFLK